MLSQQGQYTVNNSSSATATHSYTYDTAGRQITDTLACQAVSPVTATRSYDADNHIAHQVMPMNFSAALPQNNGGICGQGTNVSSTTADYSWSADGRLANAASTVNNGVGSSTSSISAHWDGDDLLYVGYPAGGSANIISLYVEKLGVIQWQSNASSFPMMVYDRDQSGTAVNEHWGTEFGQLNVDNIHPIQMGRCPGKTLISDNASCTATGNSPAPSSGGPSDYYGQDENTTWSGAAPLDTTRQDGYFDGSLAIQGVRAYDPQMNQWTTPDAYSGDVHDPMSQHPYMWNGNNPVEYSDPSGYVVAFGGDSDEKRAKAKSDYDKAKALAQSDPVAKAVFDKLEGPGFTVTLKENADGLKGDGFDAATNTLNWDPSTAALVGNQGGSQSPAVILTHEADHAQEANRNPTTYLSDRGNKNAGGYGNMEEKRVVTGSETSLARALNEGTRTNHDVNGSCAVSSVGGTCP